MLPRIIANSLRGNAAHNVLYLNNPKSGCSTVKASLWRAISPKSLTPRTQVHDLELSPFSNDLVGGAWMEKAFVFTFVRNPFTRLVSGYLDKIERRRDGNWGVFAKNHGLDPESPLGFERFVALLAQDCPTALNPHWRPQHLNVLAPFVEPNYLGHIEGMQPALAEVFARAFPGQVLPPVRRDTHRTKSARSTARFFQDPDTLTRVRRLYARDFELFGYGLDPSDTAPHRPEGLWREGSHHRLARLVALHQPDAPRLRMLKTLAADPVVQSDSFLRDWLLYERLANPKLRPRAVAETLDSAAEAIAAGPIFLRNRAAQAAAALGRKAPA